MKKIIMVLLMLGILGACTDADVASHNLSKAADSFELDRRVVFYNGVTGEYMLVIEGMCSVKNYGTSLAVTCKTGPDDYKKHYLGLSDNVTYFSEQLRSAEVGKYHYRIIFKPSVIVPNVDLE